MPRPPGGHNIFGTLYGDRYEYHRLKNGSEFWWGGNAIKARMQQAVEDGLDEIALRCITDAHPNTPFRYGYARGSLGKGWPTGERYRDTESAPTGDLPPTWDHSGAKKGGASTYILWGSAGVSYFMGLELGSSPQGRNMLRNAADKYYPYLGKAIAKHFRNPIA